MLNWEYKLRDFSATIETIFLFTNQCFSMHCHCPLEYIETIKYKVYLTVIIDRQGMKWKLSNTFVWKRQKSLDKIHVWIPFI